MAETGCWDTPGGRRPGCGQRPATVMNAAPASRGRAPRRDPMHGWCTARERRAAHERVAAGPAGSDPESEPGLLCGGDGLPASRSRAMSLDGAGRLSGFLLSARIVAYVLLAASCVWRFAGYRREFLADVGDPRRAFAFSPSSPGPNGLATPLAGDLHASAPVSLLAIGGAGAAAADLRDPQPTAER